MIILIIEAFGLNLEPWVSELCPAWAEFKQRSTLYTNNYTVAAATWQACAGLLTGEYPAYSSRPRLEAGYSRDIKDIHRTFLSEAQGNSVALTHGHGNVVREAFERHIQTDTPQKELKALLRDTPQPRLVWIYIFPGAAYLTQSVRGVVAPFCQHIRDGSPMREVLSRWTAFDPLAINAAIKPLLAIEDEVVVVCGDHGNSCDSRHATNVDEGTIKAVLAIFNPADRTEKVETRLTSHLDLVLTLQRLSAWPDWAFSADAFEHGLEQREFAYSRTCFALQGQFSHPEIKDWPPRICVTDGLFRVEILLPTIAPNAQPRLWERPFEATARYFSGAAEILQPTERHRMMEEKLIELEKKYRHAALKYLRET